MSEDRDLPSGELTLVGRITAASNATFLATVDGTSVVYKPIAGERPLWDFPDGTLAHREVAAHAVSEASGWGIVPRTWLRDGPLGPGMVQLWHEPDPEQAPIDLVTSAAVPTGWCTVLEGEAEDGRRVTLVHEDTPTLRRIAIFDIVVNNADRKGGHVLPVAAGHRFGVDHGVTFHVEDKLRTVLWGWLGEKLDADEVAGLERVRASLRGELGDRLAGLLSLEEVAALGARCDWLLTQARFPAPSGDRPTVPWPLF